MNTHAYSATVRLTRNIQQLHVSLSRPALPCADISCSCCCVEPLLKPTCPVLLCRLCPDFPIMLCPDHNAVMLCRSCPGASCPAVAVVSNHCGWADILIHMARFFPAFVARDGTQNLAMVGLIRCA